MSQFPKIAPPLILLLLTGCNTEQPTTDQPYYSQVREVQQVYFFDTAANPYNRCMAAIVKVLKAHTDELRAEGVQVHSPSATQIKIYWTDYVEPPAEPEATPEPETKPEGE